MADNPSSVLQSLSSFLMKKSVFELIKMFGSFLKLMSNKILGVHLYLDTCKMPQHLPCEVLTVFLSADKAFLDRKKGRLWHEKPRRFKKPRTKPKASGFFSLMLW